MSEYRADQALSEQEARPGGPALSVGLIVTLTVSTLTLAGLGMRFSAHGDFNILHAILILFFSVNFLVCYWEACLFWRRDYIETRTEYWRERRRVTGRAPALEFFIIQVPLKQLLSPTIWADAWATYCQYDDSYADRRTFGYNADIANGFVTPVPTLILYVAYSIDFLPALIAGIIGVALFWQWTYVTSVYWVSFFVSDRQSKISRREIYTYIVAINSYWVLCALLGLYVSICLILDGNYSILGYL